MFNNEIPIGAFFNFFCISVGAFMSFVAFLEKLTLI